MKKNRKTIYLCLLLVILIGVAALTYNYLAPKIAPPESPESGDSIKAPDFTVVDTDGNEVLLSDLLGKPVVLNFWASWCSPCKTEMPHFDEVFAEMGEDITFIMVNMVDGSRETLKTGKAYVSQQGFSFPVYYDTEQSAAIAYGVSSLPTTYFIDEEGYVITGALGQIDKETLLRGISLINPEQ